MLNIRDTRVIYAKQEKVLPGQVLTEEGAALVYAKNSEGETCVKLATGTAGEVFAGVQYGRYSVPSSAPMVQPFTVDADGKVKLTRAPIAGQLLVKIGAAPLDIVTAAPADDTEAQLAGTDLQFDVSLAGSVGVAQYLYSPTVEEARTFQGDLPLGGLGIAETETVGVLKDSDLGTSYFDAAVDWSAALFVKLAAGGKFTVGTPADHVQNVIVKSGPNAGSPYLVLSVNVA